MKLPQNRLLINGAQYQANLWNTSHYIITGLIKTNFKCTQWMDSLLAALIAVTPGPGLWAKWVRSFQQKCSDNFISFNKPVHVSNIDVFPICLNNSKCKHPCNVQLASASHLAATHTITCYSRLQYTSLPNAYAQHPPGSRYKLIIHETDLNTNAYIHVNYFH